MNTVWIVEWLDDDIPDHGIEKVFDSEAKADAYVKSKPTSMDDNYVITEVEVG